MPEQESQDARRHQGDAQHHVKAEPLHVDVTRNRSLNHARYNNITPEVLSEELKASGGESMEEINTETDAQMKEQGPSSFRTTTS